MEWNPFLNFTIKPITRDQILNAIKDFDCIDNYYQTDRIIIITVNSKDDNCDQVKSVINLLYNECVKDNGGVTGEHTDITEYIFQNFKVILIQVFLKD